MADHGLKGVTVQAFRETLLHAVAHLDTVQPEALREPLNLWFRAIEEQSSRQHWTGLDMLARPIVPVWCAARAVLDQVNEVQQP